MDTCKICSNTFKRKYSQGGKRKAYCSKSCKYKDQFIILKCPTCHNDFQRNKLSKQKEYCSLSCIQRHPCELCGKIITGRAKFHGYEKRFCSRRCSAIANSSLKAQKYIPKGFAATINKLGKICCERCKMDNICALQVHHKDRDRKNNDYHNLETLCANCHAIEHNGASTNREKDIIVAKFIAKHLLFS